MSFYLAFGTYLIGHTIWLIYKNDAIPFWSYHLIFLWDGVTSFGHLFLVIPFDFLTGMVPLLLVIYFWSWPVFQEWCHFHFKPVERDILALFLRSILDTVRPFLISSICRVCFYFSSFGY